MSTVTARTPADPPLAVATSALRSAETTRSLDSALNAVVRDSLPGLTSGLSVLFAFLGVLHFLLLPPAPGALMALVATCTSALFLALRVFIRRYRVPSAWAHPVGFGIACALLANCLLHLHLTHNPQHTTNVTLVIIGVGCYYLSNRWLALTLAVALGSWALIVWNAPASPAWFHFTWGQMAAVATSILIHTVRLRAFRRLESMRLLEARRKHELQQAVESAQQSEANLLALIENTEDFVWSVDREHRILAINSSFNRLFARALNVEVKRGTPMLEHFSPKLRTIWRDRYDRALAGERFSVEDHYEFNGLPADYEISFNPIFAADGRVTGASIFGRDITERKRAEAALRESEERYALAVEGANDGIWDWNLRTNGIYFSARWKAMLGYEDIDIGNDPDQWLERVHPDDVNRLSADLSAHLNGRTPHFENEHRIRHKDGTYRWMLTRGLAVRDEEGRAYRMAGSQTDITSRKKVEEKLLYDAFHDSLTGLPNRALFTDRLGHAIRRSERGGGIRLFAVLFLDIDRFKVVNDSLGHSSGDHLLLEMAARLQACVRPGDTVARLGGDEFVILLEDIKETSDATQIAGRIQKAFSLPFNLRGQEVFSTASIGIALSNDTYQNPHDILRDADIAMYRAKALGKARHEIFEQGMHTSALALLKLENDLRRAIEREEFSVLYQPIIELGSGHVSGFEALVRWQHPQRGLVGPQEFIPVAEETGLIVELGHGVLRRACEQIKSWNDRFAAQGTLSISVNLSAKQFTEPDLAARIGEVLQQTGLDPRYLRLEITESVIMENDESVKAILSKLKEMNLQLYLDDFGTGYSSLSYLHRLPIDALKIDRSFVSHMADQGKNFGIVNTIISLAKSLGMQVIAEGVETDSQLAHLRELNCGYAQGYLFAKPLTAADAEALIASNKAW